MKRKYTGFERVKEYPDKPIYKLDVGQFSNLSLLQKKLIYLENLDLSVIGYKKIEGLLFELLNFKTIHFTAHHPIPTLYRGRIFNPETEVIENKKDFWYPDPSIIIKRGRLNQRNESVFYSTDNFNCVFLELDPSFKDTLVICEVILKEPNSKDIFVQLGLSEKSLEFLDLHPEYKSKVLNYEKEKYNSSLFFNNIPISERSDSFVIENFLHNFMSMQKDNKQFYKMTNAIWKVLNSGDGISGVIYPNINTFKTLSRNIMRGHNIAMKPNVVDELYKVSKVWIVQKLEDNPENGNIRIDIQQGSNHIDSNGKIIWSKNPEDVKLPSNVNSE